MLGGRSSAPLFHMLESVHLYVFKDLDSFQGTISRKLICVLLLSNKEGQK